jgi:hypothetical protein
VPEDRELLVNELHPFGVTRLFHGGALGQVGVD